ncbi:hypothetical protein Tco_0728296, partial [Tanacetum coccineum]
MNNLKSDNEAVDTPLVSPFPHSDNDSNDGKVLNELIEYENTRTLRINLVSTHFDADTDMFGVHDLVGDEVVVETKVASKDVVYLCSEVRAEGSEIRIEGSSKRAEEDLQQESIKKQKVDEDNETTELQRLIEVVPDKEEVAIDAIPLATKPPSIGRIVGIKRLHDDLEVTAAKVCVTATKQ